MELWQQIGETITQIVAFTIFFILMKKFAWGPLVNVLDERQTAIEDGFKDIEQKQAEAEARRTEYEDHLRNIEAEARQKVQEAVTEGRRVAEEITDRAREEARRITEQAERNIQIEIDKARIELREEITRMTLSASERLMREKMDEARDRQLVSTFIEELEAQKP